MHPLLDDNPRQVIPRWRPSRLTMTLGELASSAPPIDRELVQPELIAQKLQEWRRERSLSFATDLLASAIVAGEIGDAREAAEYVLSPGAHASEAARNVARRVLTPLKFDHLLDGLATANREQQGLAIREARARTRSDTRNALAWIDLSLSYASLGFGEKAVTAMDVALALAPTNRYVLRSAARLFVHMRDFDRAVWVLRSAPNLKSDPWLIAAEIAVSEVGKKRSRLVTMAGRIAETSDLEPVHLSEVASAVGTVDLQAGNSKSARRLFGTALQQPTENSVAQASWASRTSHIITIDPAVLQTPRSYEARSREHLRNAEWNMALAAALQWMDDEPFAGGPAILASFIASTILEDYDEALRIVRVARIANPTDWLLTNNAAFSLASMGKIEEAAKEFATVAPAQDDRGRPPTLLATNGLIEFRRGNVSAGRALYREAIEEFERSDQRNSRALAALFLAREEALAQTGESEKALNAAREYSKTADSPELPVLLARIKKMAEQNATSF